MARPTLFDARSFVNRPSEYPVDIPAIAQAEEKEVEVEVIPKTPLSLLSIPLVLNLFSNLNLPQCHSVITKNRLDGDALSCVETEEELKVTYIIYI